MIGDVITIFGRQWFASAYCTCLSPLRVELEARWLVFSMNRRASRVYLESAQNSQVEIVVVPCRGHWAGRDKESSSGCYHSHGVLLQVSPAEVRTSM